MKLLSVLCLTAVLSTAQEGEASLASRQTQEGEIRKRNLSLSNFLFIKLV